MKIPALAFATVFVALFIDNLRGRRDPLRGWKLVGLAAAVALGGCASIDQTFFVDSKFSTEEQTQIQQAADAWEVVSHGTLHADLVFGAHVDPTIGSAWGRRVIARVDTDQISPNSEILAVRENAIGDDWLTDDKYELLSVMIPRLGACTLREVVMHELAHHFMNGGGHNASEIALMNASPQCPEADRYVAEQCIARADAVQMSRNGINVDGFRVCF